jgi:hypothetical protein
VCYEPAAGWVVDQATLEFKDAKSNKTVCTIQSKSQDVTQTVKTIIKGIVGEVNRLLQNPKKPNEFR